MRKSLRKSGCSVYTTSKMFCSQKRRMCAVQLLRVSVHERISAAAEDFLLRLEEGEEAAEIPALRALLTERLTAAAEEIVALLEETVAEYEDRVERSEREICRQRRLLDAVLKPEVKLDRSDVQQLLVHKEEVPSEQQGWSPSLEQEDIPEPPRIKEEQEELWTNQGGEQLQELEEVKEEEEDEDKGQSSQLHQRKTDNRGIMGENCGETDTNVDLHNIDDKTSEFSVAEIEVSCDDWEETKEAQLGLNCPEKPFSCPKCGKTFNKNTLLETHMRMHMGETPLSCSVCGKKYSIYRYLIKHMDIHEKMEKQHSCSTGGVESLKCDESECDKRLCYSHHLKNDTGAHPEENLFSCSVCGRKFTQRGYLNQHMARHTGKFQFRCCVCDKRFAWRHDLKSHKCNSDSSQLHQNDTEEDSEADSSSTEPESDSDKISDTSEPETKVGDDNEPHHDVSESITTNRSFICSECGNTFSKKENLKVHMRMHKEKKPVSCSYCEKHISEGKYLPNHAKVPTQEKRVLYCVCGKIFACHYNLKKGVCESSEEPVASSSRTLDSSELQIDCNRTSKSQSRLNSLKNQILKRVTSGNVAERPFGCYQCGKRFQRKRHLQEHLRIHTGEKPYGCAVCMKYFSCSGSLRKHQRIHTGEKPFSCSICGNRFTESGHLKVHMRTHTGEKPFGCSICGKGFTWRQSFINHIKYHTEKTREMK